MAWPGQPLPIWGQQLFGDEGGQVSPEFYSGLVTVHATALIFFVCTPMLMGVASHCFVPLLIGAEEMAFPALSRLSYGVMWIAFFFVVASCCSPPYGGQIGWADSPHLGGLSGLAPASGNAQSLWLMGVLLAGAASLLISLNSLVTIVQMRAPGMAMSHLPTTVWGIMVAALVHVGVFPVLLALGCMQLADHWFGSAFFVPEQLANGDNLFAIDGGQRLVEPLPFWVVAQPAVLVLILPALGIVSDLIAGDARKLNSRARSFVVASCIVAVLGLANWSAQLGVLARFGNSSRLAIAVSEVAMLAVIAVYFCAQLVTLQGAQIRATSSILFALGFVWLFAVGGFVSLIGGWLSADGAAQGLGGMGTNSLMVVAALFAICASVYRAFPWMFGRELSELWGRVHFALTFVFTNGAFVLLAIGDADVLPWPSEAFERVPTISNVASMNRSIALCALAAILSQVLFMLNFLCSLLFGKPAAQQDLFPQSVLCDGGMHSIESGKRGLDC